MELKRQRQRRKIVRLLYDDVLDVDVLNAAFIELGLAGLDSDTVEYSAPRPRAHRLQVPRAVADSGCVYVVRSGESGLYKIGSAANLEHRLSSLQTGSAEPLTLIHSISTKQSTHTVLESTLHKKLASRRLRGEWFALTESDLIALRAL